MSRGINFDAIQQEPEDEQGPVRDIVIISPEDLEAFLRAAAQQYAFFGVLFPSTNPASQVNEYIQTHWDELGAMSGRNCLLLTTLGPKRMTERTKATLARLVGEEKANKLARRYRYRPEQTASEAYQLAQEVHVDKYHMMPCMVFMTSLDSREQFLQRIPDWDDQQLTKFFEELFSRVNGHAGEGDPKRRLASLERDLGLAFMMKLQAGHLVQSVKWSEVMVEVLTSKAVVEGAVSLLLSMFGAMKA